MADTTGERTVFSLEQVARSIQKTIAERYKSMYWVKAEMNKLNHYPHSGHCFPELVEKRDGKVVAEMRSVLWQSDYQRINRQFLEVVREPLKDGITILFQASIHYDPLYGLSLKIHDIDPAYALGQLEKEKQESIARLKKEGLFTLNKQLPFPLVPKRLAIISVESSKGYSDFLQIIQKNPWGYKFEYRLFPALLQGDRSVPSIIAQLEEINRVKSDFDVVLIIRGGGGEVGLASYNQYPLAAAIARFSLPVMTGIGHSTNETVSEMVAYQSAITPSELADFLIQHFHNFAEPLTNYMRILVNNLPNIIYLQRQLLEKWGGTIQYSVSKALAQHHSLLQHQQWAVKTGVQAKLQTQHFQLDSLSRNLEQGSPRLLKTVKDRLANLEQQVQMLDPIHVLKRGFSITRGADGRALIDPQQVNAGEQITTQLVGGLIESTVTSSK